ncbi:orotidine-5'-phosphate decarboxylase [Algiphilus aromaticivorans]|jgi:orotidine-5'-phosphate decarboxylase|uniref:orotidine-5'-phosphate decarboxylase n=1 Tax=Algiphilus aromaticivorans TaxID=382454 RepID=UPI0005C149BA|nr:orotidine-5'-phosphate decarboxylase [Algiphilus aromaticivorans]
MPQTDIAARDRLIVALDLPTADAARTLVDQLGDTVVFYKIGMELAMAPGFFELLAELKARRKQVFVDLKFFDIPETVARAVRNLSERGADFCTVHGNQSIMEAAAAAKTGHTRVLAVTALTSLDQGDMDDLGFQVDIADLVLSRARRALEAGCDGVVSSGLEVARLKAEAGGSLVCVTPGIRPVENREEADQKRIMTPTDAIRAGADYLVVGRPVRDAADPRATAEAIVAEIKAAAA